MKIQNNSFTPTSLAKSEMQESKKQTIKTSQNSQCNHLIKCNIAHIELKELNQKIARIQSLQKSYQGIQKELGEIQTLANQANHNKQTLMHKIQNLHQRLNPILTQAHQQNLLNSSLHQIQKDNNLISLQSSITQEQNALQKRFENYSQQIESKFAHQKEVSFDDVILKKEEFKIAHNPSLLSSNYKAILL